MRTSLTATPTPTPPSPAPPCHPLPLLQIPNDVPRCILDATARVQHRTAQREQNRTVGPVPHEPPLKRGWAYLGHDGATSKLFSRRRAATRWRRVSSLPPYHDRSRSRAHQMCSNSDSVCEEATGSAFAVGTRGGTSRGQHGSWKRRTEGMAARRGLLKSVLPRRCTAPPQSSSSSSSLQMTCVQPMFLPCPFVSLLHVPRFGASSFAAFVDLRLKRVHGSVPTQAPALVGRRERGGRASQGDWRPT